MHSGLGKALPQLLLDEFHERHGFLQCLGAVDGKHIAIKRPSVTFSSDFINLKGHFTFNFQAAANYSYSFFDVAIKWPGKMMHEFLPIHL